MQHAQRVLLLALVSGFVGSEVLCPAGTYVSSSAFIESCSSCPAGKIYTVA